MFARVLVLATLALISPAPAQQKSMQIIVPFAPGASADGIARLIGNDLGIRLGRSIVIENKAGGGTLGLTILAKMPPDSDTLGIAATGALVINPNLPGGAGFDPLRELTPVAKPIEIPIVVAANPQAGPKTILELIARAKAGGLSYGSTGVNSGQHLMMEFFKRATGTNLTHVPYRGSAPAVTDLLGGQIPVASVDLTSALPHIQAGRLIALGVPSAQRTSLAPDIPTIAEAGVPGSNARRDSWACSRRRARRPRSSRRSRRRSAPSWRRRTPMPRCACSPPTSPTWTTRPSPNSWPLNRRAGKRRWPQCRPLNNCCHARPRAGHPRLAAFTQERRG